MRATRLVHPLVLFALTMGIACGGPRTAKVLIVRDGSVELTPDGSTLSDANPTTGMKFRWSEDADEVSVGPCGGSDPDPMEFRLVKVEIAGGHPGVRLDFKNEGSKLVVAFGGPYGLKAAGASHRLEHESEGSDLRIESVQVDGGKPQHYDRTCIRFHD